jgi:ElaB/YqjD/DUF883 family membrane-anchored ribosome-binding protein
MAETITDTLKDATDALRSRVEALRDETRYQVRKATPRVERALAAGYNDASATVRDLAGNRAVQTGVAVGLLAIVAGIILSRR